MSYTNGPRIATDGLILHLDAANHRSYLGSGTSWSDLSNNVSSGTLTHGPTYSSANKGSIVFNGANQFVQMPSNTYSFNGGSLEMWAKITTGARNQGFIGVNAPPKYLNFWMPSTNTMRWEVIGNTASTYLAINSTTAFSTGVWYHVVGTFTGALNSIYINGVLENSSTTGATNIPTSITTAVYIGDYGSVAYPLAGNISIARMYNRPLSASEIKQNYNATKGRYIL